MRMSGVNGMCRGVGLVSASYVFQVWCIGKARNFANAANKTSSDCMGVTKL